MNFQVRNISIDEMGYLINCAEINGWNPGLNDAAAFYNTDPEGFFIAELDNKPIGCISAVSYNKEFGFIGFYVMDKEYQGSYYGAALALRAMSYLKGQIIGLDGVVERIDNYAKLGFKYAYPNARYEYIKPAGFEPTPCGKIHEYAPENFYEIAKYDKMCFPAERESFLQGWLSMPNAKTIYLLDGDTIRGYGVIRKCVSGYKIGPLFADDLLPAENLLLNLIDTVPVGEKVYFDIPEINDIAKYLTHKYNMNKVFETARMYIGEFPDIDMGRVFGITSFELG